MLRGTSHLRDVDVGVALRIEGDRVLRDRVVRGRVGGGGLGPREAAAAAVVREQVLLCLLYTSPSPRD